MNRLYIILICLSTILAVSCSRDDADIQTGGNQIQFSTRIESVNPQSRADVGVDGRGQFTEGDAITLYANQNMRELQMKGGKWTPSMSWSEFSGESTTFKAFYPNVNNYNSTFKHRVEVNQNTGNNFDKSDLLYADEVRVKKGETVQLNFRHLMSCVTVVLKSNIYTDEELKNAEITLQAYNEIDVNADGTLGKVNYRVSNIPEIKLKYKEGTTFQAIVCPQTLDLAFSTWMVIKIKGKSYVISEPPKQLNDGSRLTDFQPGKNLTLTYSFDERKPDATWGNRTFWVDGLKDMPEPNSAAWKVYHNGGTFKLRHLPWSPKYGWYDANKSYMDRLDSNLCWAAASSNMIHWWIDRNRANIDRYCEINHIEPSSIPQVFAGRNDSEVFNIFKNSFENKGSYITEGIRWYITGGYSNNGNGAELNRADTGGYFKSVFTTTDKLVSTRGIGTMEHLSTALKLAFTNKYAIGFDIEFPSLPNGHALTIWGATFDEFGEVTTIYYSENNDGPLEWNEYDKNGLLEARVSEYEGTANPQLKGRACIINSQGKALLVIRDLVFLSTGQEVWEAYFSKQSAQ